LPKTENMTLKIYNLIKEKLDPVKDELLSTHQKLDRRILTLKKEMRTDEIRELLKTAVTHQDLDMKTSLLDQQISYIDHSFKYMDSDVKMIQKALK